MNFEPKFIWGLVVGVVAAATIGLVIYALTPTQKSAADAFDEKFWSTKPTHTNRDKEF